MNYYKYIYRILLEIKEAFWLTMANSLPRLSLFNNLRWKLLYLAGVKIKKSTIWAPFDLRPFGSASNLQIGEKVFINAGFRCACPKGGAVKIGDNVAIGPNCQIETVSHNFLWSQDEKWGLKKSPVIIEDRVWLGARVIVLPGVTIGHDSVIAAGTVVKEDIEPYTLVAGVPGRPVRKLNNRS